MNDGCALLIVGAVFFAAIVGAALFFDKAGCDASWNSYQHRWGPMAGCQLKLNNGMWIPVGNYRAVP